MRVCRGWVPSLLWCAVVLAVASGAMITNATITWRSVFDNQQFSQNAIWGAVPVLALFLTSLISHQRDQALSSGIKPFR